MQVPRFMRRVNRDLTNRLVGPLAGRLPPIGAVHHTGRKSGRPYRTPVLVFPVEAGLLTPLPYGTDTDWVLNLLAAGGGKLEIAGEEIPVENPRIVDSDEVLSLVPSLLHPALRLLDLPGFLLVDRLDRKSFSSDR